MVDYHELPLVTDPIAAHGTRRAGGVGRVPRQHRLSCGSAATPRRPTQALRAAAHVTRLQFTVSRVTANTMEPRGAWAEIGADGRMVVHAVASSRRINLRNGMANGNFDIQPTDIRVLTGDVGGSFGMKSGVQPEDALVAWAARKLQPPGALDLRSHRGFSHRRAGARDAHHGGTWRSMPTTNSPR